MIAVCLFSVSYHFEPPVAPPKRGAHNYFDKYKIHYNVGGSINNQRKEIVITHTPKICSCGNSEKRSSKLDTNEEDIDKIAVEN